ncbi:MAG TPA: hypothetical protein VML55_15200, partial [Planctomycetaceae bacterium]|nr:hypothetical protein [Planctomycetaceae bacterium]
MRTTRAVSRNPRWRPWPVSILVCVGAALVVRAAEPTSKPVSAPRPELERGIGSRQADLERFVPTPEMLRSTGRRGGRARVGEGLYQARITPHWFDGGTRFWYRRDLPQGRREFILVDAERGVREPAFDHARLAESLAAAGLPDARADRLALEGLEFRLADNTVEFSAAGKAW